MVVSKSGVIYGLLIFYTLLGLGMTLYGNALLQGGLTDVPNANFDNVLYNEKEYVQGTCIPKSSVDNKFQLSDLVPYWLRQECTSEIITGEAFTKADDDSITSFKFMPSIITGINHVPVWLNAILFAPLIVLFLYLLVTTLAGALFDGGS